MLRYFLNIILWFDIGLNVLIFAGSPYETISGRIGKRRLKGDKWACVICNFLDKFDPRHCEKSIVPDIRENATNWWKFR